MQPASAFAAEHGLALETTYTAKCLAALQRHEHADREGDAHDVLLWNTHAGNDLRPLVDPDWRQRSPIAAPPDDAC